MTKETFTNTYSRGDIISVKNEKEQLNDKGILLSVRDGYKSYYVNYMSITGTFNSIHIDDKAKYEFAKDPVLKPAVIKALRKYLEEDDALKVKLEASELKRKKLEEDIRAINAKEKLWKENLKEIAKKISDASGEMHYSAFSNYVSEKVTAFINTLDSKTYYHVGFNSYEKCGDIHKIAVSVRISEDVDKWPNPSKYSFLYHEYDNTIHFHTGAEEDSEYKYIIRKNADKYSDVFNHFGTPSRIDNSLSIGDKYLEFDSEAVYVLETPELNKKEADHFVDIICKKCKHDTFYKAVIPEIKKVFKNDPKNSIISWEREKSYRSNGKTDLLTVNAVINIATEPNFKAVDYPFVKKTYGGYNVDTEHTLYKKLFETYVKKYNKHFKITSKPTNLTYGFVVKDEKLYYNACAAFEFTVKSITKEEALKCADKICKKAKSK